MKPLFLVAGVLLVVGGIFSFVTGGLAWTHRKTDFTAGPVQMSHTATEHLPVAPIVSAVAVLAGAGLIFSGMRLR